MQIDTIIRPNFYTPSRLVTLIASQIIHVPQAHSVAEAFLRQLFALSDNAQLYAVNKLHLSADLADKLKHYLVQLNSGVPSAYILGQQAFYGRDFHVTPDTLIPRNETEELVDLALRILHASPSSSTILELASGSGCIAITLLAESPDKIKSLEAIDISERALQVAKHNSSHLLPENLRRKLTWHQGDLLTMDLGKNYDMIISNPPYITDSEFASLPTSVKDHEPRLALVGGIDGMDFYRRIAVMADKNLNPGGYLLLEIDARRAKETKEIIAASLRGKISHLEVMQDLNVRDRILLAQLR